MDAPNVRVGTVQVFPRAVGTVKEWKDDVLQLKDPQTPGSSRSGGQSSMRSIAGSSRSSGGRNGGQELVPRGYDFEGQGQRRRR
ncbi:MAG: hypothetical protein Q9192_007855 [Flavoplaca navasiana]